MVTVEEGVVVAGDRERLGIVVDSLLEEARQLAEAHGGSLVVEAGTPPRSVVLARYQPTNGLNEVLTNLRTLEPDVRSAGPRLGRSQDQGNPV